MTLKKKFALALLTLLIPLQTEASLTLYTTSWSMYGDKPYEYDGAYKNGRPYGQLAYVANPDMVAQFNKADVLVWGFMQVWNTKDPQQAQYQIPEHWQGLMHFSDLWGELPFEASWVNPLPPETAPFLTFCKANEGSCASVQTNGNTQQKELFNYTDQKGVGQLNSFGAFIHSDKYKAKRIIAIGGANTLENKSISTASFDAIFENQTKFLNQFKSWMNHFKNLNGVDYDFEPPIDPLTGGQYPADERTLKDYKHLFELVKASRATLGKEAYISVTITVNKKYLEKINLSVEGGWFKAIAPYVNTVNLMTYDLHGPWSKISDPFTSIHAFVQQPESAHKEDFEINYGALEITDQVLSYGIPKEKVQIGIAGYGRGFSGVSAGSNTQYPGFEQPWEGPSQFDSKYTKQNGLVPYSAIDSIVKKLNYKIYPVHALDALGKQITVGAYIYNSETRQFVGYQSPETIKSIYALIKTREIQGAILWSADMDLPVENPLSLVATYKNHCN